MSNQQSLKDCIERIDRLVVIHPRFRKALDRIEGCLFENVNLATPRGLLIVGPSGSGKSTLRNQVIAMQGRIAVTEREKPIVCVSVPSIPTIKSLANTVLCSMGDPLWHKGTAPQLTHRAVTLLRGLATRLVLLDEMQHLADSSGYRGISRVADWIKEVMDQATANFVLLGLPRAEEVLKVNEQLRRRFAAKVELSRFDIDDPDDFLDFRHLLAAFEGTMQFKADPRLSDSEMAERIYYASDGLPGYLKELLIGALRQASNEDIGTIGLSHLATAFREEIWAGGVGDKNPFDRKFQFRRLDGSGEPFSCATLN